MKRLFFFLLLCFSILTFNHVLAQEVETVPLRTSMRDDYSRIVFGWPNAVTPTVTLEDAGVLLVSFNKPGQPDLREADFSQIPNIGQMTVRSTDPLIVAFTIPQSSTYRDFKIGKRIILDVYNPENPDDLIALAQTPEAPEGGEQEQEELYSDSPEPEEVVATLEQADMEEPEEVLPSETLEKVSKAETPKEPAKDLNEKPPVKIELVPERAVKQQKEEPPAQHDGDYAPSAVPPKASHDAQALNKAVHQEYHVMSLRAAKSLSLAVFESYGDMYWVINQTGSFLKPSLSSPKPELFSDFSFVPNDQATVYRTELPEIDLVANGKGGGLVWDLILDEKGEERGIIDPVNIVSEISNARGGKVLWPLENVGDIIEMVSPVNGAPLIVVTVENASSFAGPPRHYVDFNTLKSSIGLVIQPKVDDLKVEKVNNGVEISRPSGLALGLPRDLQAARLYQKQEKRRREEARSRRHSSDKNGQGNSKPKPNQIYKFHEWNVGEASDLTRSENVMLSALHSKPVPRMAEDLLELAKMFFSHGRAAEALGYLEYARSLVPGLEGSPEFLALRGASQAFDWKSEDALRDLSHRDLKDKDEIKFWRSYILADLGDWKQAAESLPANYASLYNYPPNIATRLALSLAEVNLRDGNVGDATALMDIAEKDIGDMPEPMKAELKYLQGEANRQKKNIEKTEEVWKALTQDKDDLFRTKAGLALTILNVKNGKITTDQAIDNLERLRYAWRGDELEAQVNYWLGTMYFENKNFMKGLNIMRDAATFAQNETLAERITGDMGSTFSNLFLGPDLKNVSALDAISVFDQFSELTPVGAEGDKIVQMLAEHLVRSDLLTRASKLLQYQVDHRLKGKEKLRVAIRLAAIELLDQNPQKAIDALIKAEETMRTVSEPETLTNAQKEIDLLRIRAYSQNEQYDKALALLENVDEGKGVNRLKADIAWQAGYWDDAADALKFVIEEENISMTRPLNDEQASLILNRAIALSLDNDRVALANMRKTFADLMMQSPKGTQFEVITRPRGSSELADRETLMSAVSEVDLFKEFLDSYRKGEP